MTAGQAAHAIANGIQSAIPDARCHLLPLADGGEGTASAFIKIFGGTLAEGAAVNAAGRPVTGRYAWTASIRQAVIEMSDTCGLAQLPPELRDPMRLSTRGVGQVIRNAALRDAATIIVGLGGSATNDGGSGMAAALGFRFLDASGAEVDPVPENLLRVVRIESPRHLSLPQVVVVSDVLNPLLGPRGASRVFGPQKGASPESVERLEKALEHLADLVARDLGTDPRDAEGAGAAGGLGFGLAAFCRAKIQPGFETFAELAGLDELVRHTDIVATGEGALDTTTLEGKGPGGLAKLARASGKKVIGFCGRLDASPALSERFDAILPIADGPCAADDAIRRGPELLAAAAARAASLIRIGLDAG